MEDVGNKTLGDMLLEENKQRQGGDDEAEFLLEWRTFFIKMFQ